MNSDHFTVNRRRFKKEPLAITLLFIAWALLLIISVALTFETATTDINRYYDKQIQAANLAKTAMDEIKNRKNELNIPMSKFDRYNCGLIGESLTEITTTSGILEAKLTSCNPDFAAVYIDMFRELGLKPGDQIAIVMSGSFPMLNISALCAAEVYGLKTCTMASIGASSYGANDVNFTFFDMIEYLNEKGIINIKIDYISFGGANDDGLEFPDDIRNAILDRINSSGVGFLCESDYPTNIAERTRLIYEKCPNIKFLISVGGTIIGMGIDEAATVNYRGLVKPNYLNSNDPVDKNKLGLLDTFLRNGVPVAQMLNIKGIAIDYGIAYNPSTLPEIGQSNAYYEVTYNLFISIISLLVSIGLLIFYKIYRKKHI